MSTIRLRTAVSVINKEQEILLVPHLDHKETLWYLPGGGVEYLEKTEAAAVREYEEETGFDVKLISSPQVIQYIDHEEPWHSVTFLYKAIITGGTLRPERSKWGLKTPVWYTKTELSSVNIVPYLREVTLAQFD